MTEESIRQQMMAAYERGEISVWSCDPADIPPWTEESKARLHKCLAEVFGWEKTDEAKGQDGRTA